MRVGIRDLIRPLLPAGVLNWHRRRTNLLERLFSNIYKYHSWGGRDYPFYSGSGADERIAGPYCQAVVDFIARHRIDSLVDLGCGDFRVGAKIAACGVDYCGVDIVPELITLNSSLFGTSSIRFQCKNIVTDRLPPAQLCLIRQVLQHLSNDQILAALRRCRHYEYLIITEHLPNPKRRPITNVDKMCGADIRLSINSGVYLDRPPFNMNVAKILCESQPYDDESIIQSVVIVQTPKMRELKHS
jgi:SAM-dependent methyltransferase